MDRGPLSGSEQPLGPNLSKELRYFRCFSANHSESKASSVDRSSPWGPNYRRNSNISDAFQRITVNRRPVQWIGAASGAQFIEGSPIFQVLFSGSQWIGGLFSGPEQLLGLNLSKKPSVFQVLRGAPRAPKWIGGALSHENRTEVTGDPF